jgi:hypothetical protein
MNIPNRQLVSRCSWIVLANFADVLRESLRLKAVNHKVRQEGPALGHMYLDRFQGRV